MRALDIINTRGFRELLGVEDIGKDPIVKWSPNSVHILRDFVGGKAIIQAFFWRWDHVQNKLDDILTQVDIANDYKRITDFKEAILHYTGEKRLTYKYPRIYLQTDTFANAEATVMAILSASNATWSTVRDATSGSSAATSWVDTAGVGLGADFNSPNYRICRGWFHYNTASIPDSASISSAFIRLPGTATRNTNTDTTTLDIVQSTVVSDTALVAGDYDLRGTTVWGDFALSGWSTSGNNDIALNGTGISNISLTGYSKFAITNSRDTDGLGTAPTGANSITFDQTEANQILSVTYPVAAGGLFIFDLL